MTRERWAKSRSKKGYIARRLYSEKDNIWFAYSEVESIGDIFIEINEQKIVASFTVGMKSGQKIKQERKLKQKFKRKFIARRWLGAKTIKTPYNYQDYFDDKNSMFEISSIYKDVTKSFFAYLRRNEK